MSSTIYIYIFSDTEKRGQTSDERICRCSRHFIQSETKTNIKIPAIYRGQNEKPRFEKEIGLDFSVSHSGKYWLCAVSTQKIGIDIQEKTNQYQPGIAERFFHPNEYNYLLKNGFNDFFSVWTAKESYVKHTGQGITDDFSSFSVIQHDRICELINGLQIKFFSLDSDYCFCVCATDIQQNNIKFERQFENI